MLVRREVTHTLLFSTLVTQVDREEVRVYVIYDTSSLIVDVFIKVANTMYRNVNEFVDGAR